MLALLFSPLGRLGAAGVGIAVFLGWFASDQRSRVIAKISKETSHAVNTGKSAGSKSVTGNGGVLDPYTVDDK